MNEPIVSLLLALAIALLYVSTRQKLNHQRRLLMALKDTVAEVKLAQEKVSADVQNVQGLVGTFAPDPVTP